MMIFTILILVPMILMLVYSAVSLLSSQYVGDEDIARWVGKNMEEK